MGRWSIRPYRVWSEQRDFTLVLFFNIQLIYLSLLVGDENINDLSFIFADLQFELSYPLNKDVFLTNGH